MSETPFVSAAPIERQSILLAIHAERQRQDLKWGGPRHDDEHSRRDWIAFIVEQAADASTAVWPADYRIAMVKVAAVAVAAIESNDRRVARECEADKDYQAARTKIQPAGAA